MTILSVAGLLAAERRGSQRGKWMTKPVASIGFLGAALAAGALDTRYGLWVLTALFFSFLGDVLLIPKNERVFRAGILAFLLGHVAFVAAFVSRGLDPSWCLFSLVPIGVMGAAVLRWLTPHLSAEMRGSVYAYVGVISLMVVSASGTFGHAPDGVLLAGALGFFLSDLSVARDRFVAHRFANRAWGLPLYYGAQLLLASTVIRDTPN